MALLEIRGLSKSYKQHFWTPSRQVLYDLNLDVHEGEVFGFLGPNGAGKSTTIKILFEIIFPSSGYAKIFGRAVGHRDSKQRIGFLPENSYFHDYLTSENFLRFHGRLCRLSESEIHRRIPEVLDEVGMRGTQKIRLREFSKGMLQRIGLAQAIIHDPDFVVLDEPMTGLDPMGRKEVRDLMIRLRDRGKTIFFSTHILSDVESICDRVAIMNKGRLLSCGPLEALVSIESKYADITWANKFADFDSWLQKAQAELINEKDLIFVRIRPGEGESQEDFEGRVNQSLDAGRGQGGVLKMLSHKQDSLEDVFVKQVGVMQERV